MRVLIDYRAALSRPSGVGEYTRQLAAGLASIGSAAAVPVHATIFSSSWKERLQVLPELNGIATIDLRLPVSVLNFAWHRLGWPQVETLTDSIFDVAHSLHPLLMPSRSAAQVVTIYDLDFIKHPERTESEIRRDYPDLAPGHAARADQVMVSSQFTAGEVERQFGVPAERISVCYPGAPDWTPRGAPVHDGYILFLGTLEPRKNVGTLLDAYERLLTGEGGPHGSVPELVLAGRATPASASWLERVSRAPLAGHVRHIGYVDSKNLKSLFEGARMLVQPSFEEGFGLPPLEAMTLGVPVVAANRGSIPEVVGDAGLLVDADSAEAMAAAIGRLLDDAAFECRLAAAGPVRARAFRRETMAARAIEAYMLAIEHRAQRRRLT